MSFSSCSDVSITKYFDKNKKEVQPGDLIEIFRRLYQHWAVYVGCGNIVHFGKAEDGSSSSSSSSSSGGGGVERVLREKLEKVVGNDDWKVNNLLDDKYKPLPANDIVEEACKLVNTELEFKLLKSNCEHFATQMRYGRSECRQVKAAMEKGGKVASGVQRTSHC
ncbi:phospholipase A and acyltransferase 4-like [Cololabis saira]|uniref:phospholipase A and acyltransferase 4-like n=1 Tax=Cololabis saira TaxID=129043 RepID=UPI002AD50B85|nr:phospholipase A and acyltransferase 4-like [Cololabis saira]